MVNLYKMKRRSIPVRIWVEDYEKEIKPIIKEMEEAFRNTRIKPASIPEAISIRLNRKEIKKKVNNEEDYKIF